MSESRGSLARPRIIFLMGVSGSGKTTVGHALSNALSIPFYDGDDFHPTENITKMRSGLPLNDDDRYSWLQRLHALANEMLAQNGAIIACSALKETYRGILSMGIKEHCDWVLLEGTFELIEERMQRRPGHFMPVALLKSQFETLEIPDYALRTSIAQDPDKIVRQIMQHLSIKDTGSTLGIVGLGVMGRSLALNFADKGYVLSLYNRRVPGKEEDVAQELVNSHKELEGAKVYEDIPAFVHSLARPRRILLMVDAGAAVDTVVEQILPLLSQGDVIADCGNSHYQDTERRQALCKNAGVFFLGVGVSGGESGARFGPAIMPGGQLEGYQHFGHLLESIAAKDPKGKPCCGYLGNSGAGHFVKMVHNGIEYAEMQLIAEVYGYLRFVLKFDPDVIAERFLQWDHGANQSFLLNSTVQLLRMREHDDWLIDKIVDAARSKGTGGWTLDAANQLGTPAPVIAAAVYARFSSGRPEERQYGATFRNDAAVQMEVLAEKDIEEAYLAARTINHHLGFLLLKDASVTYGWELPFHEIARIWTNGCIIRSALMEKLNAIFIRHQDILDDEEIGQCLRQQVPALQRFVAASAQTGTSVPCHSAALQYLFGLDLRRPTANILQGQRDFFGAHGFQRTDDPTGGVHHLN